MAFISGGLEVSFPISHTPSQIETLHLQVVEHSDRCYVYCGETELRFGMQYTLEFSLGAGDNFLTQRCAWCSYRDCHPCRFLLNVCKHE